MKILTKKEKTELVIKLYKKGQTYKEIVKTVRISLRDIGKTINEYNRKKDNTKFLKSNTIKGYKLLLAGLSPVEVTIELGLSYEEIRDLP